MTPSLVGFAEPVQPERDSGHKVVSAASADEGAVSSVEQDVCGIVGVSSAGGIDEGHLAVVCELTSAMWRRGPDDQGVWTDGHTAAFGFRRLSVIDVSSAGAQPMTTSDGRYVLVYNGEVYNYRQLRKELEALGVRFRSMTDSEVVLQSLTRWGPSALRRFNGIFALGFYDCTEKRLLLARDPLGVKPLYFLSEDDKLLFASQYDQILRHPWGSRLQVDQDALQLYLRLGYVPPPFALAKNTHMLSPGHFLVAQAGRLQRVEAFYSLPEPVSPLMSFDEAVQEMPSVMRGAVERQMISDVPLGTFLSAGVDSPLVSAFAQQCRSAPVDAFTVSVEDPALDEGPKAASIARGIGLNHFMHKVTSLDAEDAVLRAAEAFHEPFADHSSIPTMLISGVARERVTVALSGDGGDELFFGYPRFRKVLNVANLFRLPKPLRVARYGLGRGGILESVPAGIRFRDVGAWYLNSHSYWTQANLEAGAPQLATLPQDFDLYRAPVDMGFDTLSQWLRRTEIEGHLQRILLKVDRASMYHHLEVRVPFLDLEVVEFAMRLDPRSCFAGGRDKAVLRAVCSNQVADASVDSPKKGFTVPMGDWLRGPLKGLVHDLLLARDPFPVGVFDRSMLRRAYREHCSGRDLTLVLWSALSLQLWWAQSPWSRSDG